MKKYLLLDLDGTLLANNMDEFLSAYYHALSQHLLSFVDPQLLIRSLLASTKAMIANSDPTRTLEQTFDAVFYPQIGVSKTEIHSEIDRFYIEKFPALQIHTSPIPGAVELVLSAIAEDYSVSIATNPLFPQIAILHRLKWANLDPKDYRFELIPSYESFHFSKPNPAFYTEFIGNLKAVPDQCYMVGNDMEMDITPSLKAGLHSYLISSEITSQTNGCKTGPLSGILPWLAGSGKI